MENEFPTSNRKKTNWSMRLLRGLASLPETCIIELIQSYLKTYPRSEGAPRCSWKEAGLGRLFFFADKACVEGLVYLDVVSPRSSLKIHESAVSDV